MKKYSLILLTIIMVVLGCFTAFADCWWDDDNYGLKANWDQLSSKGTLYLYKGSSYKVGNKISVSTDKTSYDFTERITNMGPGTYHFTITDKEGRTWESEDYQVDEDMLESFGKLTWYQEQGVWKLKDFKGMLMTGWQFVDGKWYYLDLKTGKCWMDARTPDGYYVGPDGAWVVGQ